MSVHEWIDALQSLAILIISVSLLVLVWRLR